jgi:four helix bundle protein
MPETRDDERATALKRRTKDFAVGVLLACRKFPRSQDGTVVAKQLIRSATSVAANYRAACRSRSAAEFVAKIGLVAEEADESEFWLELAIDAKLSSAEKVNALLREAGELTAIFTALRSTAKRNLERSRDS